MPRLVMSRGNFLKYNLYQKLYSKKYNFPIGLYINFKFPLITGIIHKKEKNGCRSLIRQAILH